MFDFTEPPTPENRYDIRNNLYAEFDKLPLKVKGMVFVADTIDMDWTDSLPVEVPELTCRSDLDPFSDSIDVSAHPDYIPANISGTTVNYPVHGGTSGFIDLFHKSNYASKVYFVVGSTTYGNIEAVSSLPTFDSTQILEPGMLEPMLDTDFKPINIDTITNVEAIIDGLDFSFINLNNWKASIDDRIKNLYSVVNTSIGVDTDLRDLTSEEYKESECDNFQILLADGDPLKTVDDWNVTSQTTIYGYTVGQVVGGATVAALWSELVAGTTVYYCATEREPNTYTITEGNIKIGEYYVTVPAVTGIIAPFYAYLTTGPLDSSHQAVATYAEVPTVEEDGQTVKIHNGSVMPDGGVVANFTHTIEDTYTWDVCYDHTISAFGQINILNGMDLNEYGTADPPAGGIGIGGVRVIAGGTADNSYLMYKIYHEDCITSAPLADGTAIVNQLYPSTIPEQNGPENPAGIVYPYDHIVSGTTGSTRLDWGRSAYVPTVTATYKFVHNESYGTSSPNADQALAYAYVIQGGQSTDTETWDVPIATDISLPELYRDKAAAAAAVITPAYTDYQTASAAYDTAAADYADAEAAWIAAGSPTNPSDPNYATYTAKQEAQQVMTAAGVTAENARISYNAIAEAATCTVTGGTPGTVFAIDDMVFSNGVVLGASVPAVTVPSVNAVHNYIHSAGALNLWGTYVPAQNNSPAHIAHGTPGTVFTVDWIDRDICLAGGDNSYYYSEVPTVFAVVDYVDGQLGAPAEPGVIVLTTTNQVESESVEDIPVDPPGTPTPHDSGTVQNVENILVGATPSVSMQAVPTVKAVYDFVHYEPVEGGTFSDPLADLGTMTAHAAVEYQPAVAADLNANPPVAAQEEVPAQAASVSFAGTPGTCRVADNIETVVVSTQNGNVTLTAPGCVPTAQAVVDYVLSVTPGQTPDSVSGTLVYDGTNNQEGWLGNPYDTLPVRGTVEVAKGILVATNPARRNLTPQAVASVNAVYTFIHSTSTDATGSSASTQALAFRDVITVTAGQNNTESESIGNAVPGTTYVVNNVQVATTRSYSEKSVPTVAAIYDFIHNSGTGGAGEPIARALATPGAMTEHPAVAADTAHDIAAAAASVSVAGTPGTFFVASDIVLVTGTTETAPNCVPTAQAVVTYIANLDYSGVIGSYTATASGETWETSPTDKTGKAGLALVVNTIEMSSDATKRSISSIAVPTVEAIKSYVDAHTGVSTAVAGTLVNGTNTEEWTTVSPAVQHVSGVVDVSTSIVVGGTPSISESAVPTIKAVYDFIHYGEATTAMSSPLASPVVMTASTVSPTLDNATPGTMYVADSIEVDITGETTAENCVPTAQAVVNYVAGHAGGDMLFPNIRALGNVDISNGIPSGQGFTFLVPVKKNWTIGVNAGGCSVCAVYAPSDASTASVPCNSNFPVPADGYARISVIDNGTTNSCVQLVQDGNILPLYKSWNTMASNASSISVSDDSESFSGSPGRVYIASTVNFSDSSAGKTYSPMTAPSVEAVYDFIHCTTTTDMKTSLCTVGVMGGTTTEEVEGEGVNATTVSTSGATVTGAVAGTCLVVGNIVSNAADLDESSVLSVYVPTAGAVVNYITALGICSADPGTIVGGANETWDQNDSATRGTVLVASNIAVGTTVAGQTISIEAVPTVMAVHTFVSGYTASPGTINVPSSGNETWSTASTAGLVKVANNIAAADTQVNRVISETAVPTVYAVKTYVDNHVQTYTGPFAVDVTAGTVSAGRVYYPGGYADFTGGAIPSASTATEIWLRVYRTANSAAINTALAAAYTRTIYEQDIPIAWRATASDTWIQCQFGPAVIEGRWE